MSHDRLVSTTKVETFSEMMHGGFTQGNVSEGSFGNKKLVPSMIVASANKGNMISGKKSMGGMISTKTKGKK